MKNLALFLFFYCGCLFFVSAQNSIHYVWAPNGLNLRGGGAKSVPVLKKLSFGKKVTVLEELPGTDSVKEVPGFYITGHWVKAVADKDTGYLFNGYLDTYKPVSYSYKEYEKYPGGILEKFLYTYFAPNTPKKVLEYGGKGECPDETPRCPRTYETDFKGIRFRHRRFGESGSTNTTIVFPNMPLQRIYLWAIYRLREDGIPFDHQISYQNGILSFDTQEAGCWLSLSLDSQGHVVWEEGCAC